MYLIFRSRTLLKLFALVIISGLFMYLTLAFYSLQSHNSVVQDKFKSVKGLRWILMWTDDNETDMEKDEEGQRSFLNNNCKCVNCYITTNKTFLNGNYTNFDAIIFNFNVQRKWLNLPKYRSKHQKYVFYSRIPANEYPICDEKMDNFFNWTWTYKFGSDIFSPFIEVRDIEHEVIAPSLQVDWTLYTYPIMFSHHIDSMNTKTKAVMWIVNDCKYNLKRTVSIRRLAKALAEHSLVLDVYGCGNKVCPEGDCVAAIKRDYYFYLIYETSFSEDYVTDEVMMAYDHGAVPIIIGGADYTKFLPDGSYISFHGMKEDAITNIVADTILQPKKYSDFFKWRNKYTIHKVNPTEAVCQLCKLLNNAKFKSFSTYENFRKWWYIKPLPKRCRPKKDRLIQDFFL